MTAPLPIRMSASTDIVASDAMMVPGHDRYGGVWSFRFLGSGEPVVAITISDGDDAKTLRMSPRQAMAFADAVRTEAMKITVEGNA